MGEEAGPWQCHRSLIADALLIRGWEVQHILSETNTNRHQLTSFAIFENGVLVYPNSDDGLRLFYLNIEHAFLCSLLLIQTWTEQVRAVGQCKQ